MAALALVRVARDGNPLRAHGWAAPFFGKLAPFDPAAADALARAQLALLAARRSAGKEEVLVVGLAESSLLPAWWLAHRLAAADGAPERPAVALALSTRRVPPAGADVTGDAGSSPAGSRGISRVSSPANLPASAPAHAFEETAAHCGAEGVGAAGCGFGASGGAGASPAAPPARAAAAPAAAAAAAAADAADAVDAASLPCWLAFREPHSHAPCHYLLVPRAAAAAAATCGDGDGGGDGELGAPSLSRGPHVVIVEDEITTGRTLSNLVCELAGVVRPSRIDVLALVDLRSRADAAAMEQRLASVGCDVAVLALASGAADSESVSLAGAGAACAADSSPAPLAPLPPLPPLLALPVLGSAALARGPTDAELRAALAEAGASCVIAVGECVEAPLRLAADLASAAGGAPLEIRFLTRSPWLVDGGAIRSRAAVTGAVNGHSRRYFLYNYDGAALGSAVVIAALPHEAEVAHAAAVMLRDAGCRVVRVCAGDADIDVAGALLAGLA